MKPENTSQFQKSDKEEEINHSCPNLSNHANTSKPLVGDLQLETEIKELDEAIQEAEKEEEEKSKSPRLPLLQLKKPANSVIPEIHVDSDNISSATKLVKLPDSKEKEKSHSIHVHGRQNQNRRDSAVPMSIFEIEEEVDKSFTVKSFPPIFKRYTALFCCLLLIFYYLSVLGLLIALLVVHLDNKRYFLESTSGALEYIAKNLESDPILNIIASADQCPENFEAISLTTWPGIPDGCYYLEDGVLHPSLCNKISDNKAVYSFYEIDLFKWKGLQFCAQRALPELDYILTPTCPSSFRECFSGMCVKESIPCPITNIYLGTESISNESTNFGSLFLNIYREPDELPLQSLSVTIESLSCFGTNENFVSVEPYNLFNKEPRDCGMFGYDENSFQIDNDTESNFLTSNNVSNPILNLSEYQSVLSNTTVILAGRKRIEVTPSEFCLNLDLGILKSSADKSKKFEQAVSAQASVAFIFHLIIGLLLMNLFCGRLWFGFSLNELLWEKKFGYKILFIFFLILEMVTALVLAIYMNVYRFGLKSSNDYYEELVRQNCFRDDQASTIITNYGEFIHDNVSVLLIYSLLVFVITGIYFLIVIYIFVRIAKKSPKKEITS